MGKGASFLSGGGGIGVGGGAGGGGAPLMPPPLWENLLMEV